jgi:hypothetical protein
VSRTLIVLDVVCSRRMEIFSEIQNDVKSRLNDLNESAGLLLKFRDEMEVRLYLCSLC